MDFVQFSLVLELLSFVSFCYKLNHKPLGFTIKLVNPFLDFFFFLLAIDHKVFVSFCSLGLGPCCWKDSSSIMESCIYLVAVAALWALRMRPNANRITFKDRQYIKKNQSIRNECFLHKENKNLTHTYSASEPGMPVSC